VNGPAVIRTGTVPAVHDHHGDVELARRVERGLLVALGTWALLVLVGLVVLWPDDRPWPAPVCWRVLDDVTVTQVAAVGELHRSTRVSVRTAMGIRSGVWPLCANSVPGNPTQSCISIPLWWPR